MSATTTKQQPQVLPQYTLLASGYLHAALDADGTDAYVLDLYGVRDEDGVEVSDVTLAGSPVSLGNLINLSRVDLIAMTDWVTYWGSTARAEQRIDWHECDRAMA